MVIPLLDLGKSAFLAAYFPSLPEPEGNLQYYHATALGTLTYRKELAAHPLPKTPPNLPVRRVSGMP